MTVLVPNSLNALKWGICNFDAIEFDVRLTRDNVPVIHHDTSLKCGRKIQDLTLPEVKIFGIITLDELLNDSTVIREANMNNKILWLELKPFCKYFRRVSDEKTVNNMYEVINKVIDSCGTNPEQIRIFSFSVPHLIPFAKSGKYKVYPIFPDINECATNYGLFRQFLSLPRFFFKNLFREAVVVKKYNMSGFLFTNHYVNSIRAFYHPKLSDIMDAFKGMDLVTQADTIEEREKFRELIRLTDKIDLPRRTGNYSNHIIIHRGCGNKPIEVDEIEDI